MVAKITFVYNNAPSFTLKSCHIDRINWTTSMAYVMDINLNPLFIQEFDLDCLAIVEDDGETMTVRRNPSFKHGVSVHADITTGSQRMRRNNPDYVMAKLTKEYAKYGPPPIEWTPEIEETVHLYLVNG